MATTTEQVQYLYIGLLGRAADAEGLAYWVNEIDSGILTLEQLRSNIVNEQPEYTNGMGQMSRTQLVTELYQNLFEREPDAGGLDYWVNGGGSSVNADQLILALVDGASAPDQQVLGNKTTAAEYYTANLGGPDTYNADAATAAVADVNGSQASLDASFAFTDAGGANSNIFTLTEATVSRDVFAEMDVSPETETVTYWGFAAGTQNADGDDFGAPFNDGELNAIPLTELVSYIQTLAGLDFVQLGLINVASGQDDGLNSGDTSDGAGATQLFSGFEGVSGFSIVNNNTSNDSGTVDATITFELDDGSVNEAEVDISEELFEFLNNLLFDSNGDSRLFEKTIEIWPRVPVLDENGEPVRDIEGNLLSRELDAGDTITSVVGEEDVFVPIKLTPTENNGGTLESGLVSSADDTIVAGRLDLLHRAYIDAGRGYDTLEIDAKGEFAQPLQLLNIEQVSVTNLPNV
ncbi:MAG: DUF4214 domain-containing protein, partial [Chromatocurvus sp.]